MTDFFKEKIDHPDLTPDLQRVRNGHRQEFRNKGQSWDTEPVVKLEYPDRPELYAELIDGEWYWVNGCPLCDDAHHNDKNGSYGYRFCHTHDVCVTCGVGRDKLTEIPWGVKYGAFRCKPCQALIDKEEKIRAVRMAMIDDLDEDDTAYLSEIKCPYCGDSFNDDDGSYADQSEHDYECPVCDETFTIQACISIEYSTTPKRPIAEVRKEILGDEYESDDDDVSPQSENAAQTLTDALPERNELSDVITQAAKSEAGNASD